MAEKYYLTTAIPYTSRKPHIGNTYEMILTDAIARFKRLNGFDVFFLTGTDEHGQKIEDAAREEGITPQQYVDRITDELKGIWSLMDISYDKFIRTTDDYHVKAVQNIFKKLYDQGDIYKGEYEGWYCTPCESFWTETQAAGCKCPDCGRDVQKSKEAAYFLKLSKYQKQLEDYIESHPDFIYPEARKKEMVNNFIKPGVQDLCVSRSTFKWGVPVSFDDGHVIYVWMDALINYITALGYDIDEQGELFKKYWPANVQIIGKDILRFHTIYWPVILMALGLPLPQKIFGHPWLLVGFDKMSKSRGNAIYADDLANYFGSDAVRYFVLAEMPYLNDGSITYESFIARYNSDLANTLGNLVNRTVAMINKYFDGVVPSPIVKEEVDEDLIATIENGVKKVSEGFETFHIADASDEIMTILRRLNKYIDETTPWVLGKDETKKDRLATVMYNLYEGIRISATLLFPFMPSSAEKIIRQINDPENILTDITNWADIEKFGRNVPSGAKVNSKPEPLFVRIDEEKKMSEITAANESAKAAKENKKPEKLQKNDAKNDKICDDALIDIDDFAKVKLVCAKILSAEPVEKSDKLLKIMAFDGCGERQIVSGIAKSYTPDELVGKKVILVANLKPAKLRGVESHGMLLAAGYKDEDGNENIKITFLDDSIPEGSVIR
ncbi:MAG: methionine--tRNA ligase [Ruminococcaceae bacterium]|nr:methionine--tRNA ligase [Oscillospiraceae bacterium]